MLLGMLTWFSVSSFREVYIVQLFSREEDEGSVRIICIFLEWVDILVLVEN